MFCVEVIGFKDAKSPATRINARETLDQKQKYQLEGPKYKLDTETKGSTVFRNSRALGCSDPSAARALLRARGFLNTVDPVGRGI